MKKITTILFAAAVAMAAQAQTWTQDKAHSKLGFAVTHLLISEVQGSFKTFDVKITATKDDLSDAVFEVTADIGSINTDVEGRDNDLKSDKFFDAAKFPTLSFKSTSFKKVEGKKYALVGDLTLKGVTKSVTLDVTLNGPVEHPRSKKPMAGLKISGTFKRSDFGVGTIPVGVVSDEVSVMANGEIVKQ
jgi:polyisoprenoid-binding protein YceI